ncbi:MAG: PIN domain-containing protein [Bacteroidales bacterium]|nr:PIN domain-containing protein [Bacteroidales bacterium]
MKGYLLDTSICVAMFRGDCNVGAKLNEVGKERCFITQIVVAELLFGAYRSKHVEENLRQTYDFIKNVKMLPFDDCLETFAKERARLWDAGKPIEDFDLLIGCAAKAAGLTMVTHNVKHFCHIEGLEIEDWVKEM